MAVSGLVITLSEEQPIAQQALDAITAHDNFELGRQNLRWLPVVMQTPSDQQDKNQYRWLEQLPGVSHVEMLFVSLDHDEDLET